MTTFISAVINAVRLVGRGIAAVHRGTVVRFVNDRRRRRGRPEMESGERRLVAIITGFVVIVTLIGLQSRTSSSAATAIQPSAKGSTGTTSTVDSDPPPTTGGVRTESAPPVAQPSGAPLAGDGVMVASIIDGDTFALTDGRHVRVLGIDSCEADTPGGREATLAASSAIENQQVILTAEPGVESDPYGRLLRYVRFSGGDFGEHMVEWDHTGVYEGSQDASSAYVSGLYARDLRYASNPPTGRSCGQDPPISPSSQGDNSYSAPNNDNNRSRAGGKVKGYVCRKSIFC